MEAIETINEIVNLAQTIFTPDRPWDLDISKEEMSSDPEPDPDDDEENEDWEEAPEEFEDDDDEEEWESGEWDPVDDEPDDPDHGPPLPLDSNQKWDIAF